MCKQCVSRSCGSTAHRRLRSTAVNLTLVFPTQINLGLLIFSLAGFLLPAYLFYHRRQLIREKEAREKQAAENQPLNYAETNGHKPHTNGLN